MEGLISISDDNISSNLCEILKNLLVPDSAVIEKATSELRQLNKHSSFVPSLFSVLAQSNEPEIRKLAAVIFRRKVSRQWKSFSRDICIGVRKAVLERLLIEPDIKVSQSLSQIAASIAKYELATDNSWPDLFQLIKEGTKNEKSLETTLFLLRAVCESASEPLEPHYIDLLQLLDTILSQCDRKEHENIAVYAVKAFDSLIPYLGDEYAQLVRPLVLKCVAVTQMLLESDESLAADVMEVFESLIETEVSFISPFVKDLVLFSLQIASRTDLEDTTRVRALSLLRWIIKLKKKAVIKLSLVVPILDAVFPIITSQCDAEDDEEINFASDDVESQYPITSSLYIIDELALHLPPEKLFHSIMPKIEMLVASNEPHHSRGLILTLACLAEGTSEYIKNNHLKPFLELVCRFSMHENQNIRNASLFAIGQFSEHLQPDISKYSSEVMPLLFDILQKTPETSKGITRTYYAIENFVENLGDDIKPYLDQLITHLLTMLRTSTLVHTKELVVSAIGAVANAAKENLLPYLGQILSQLQECLPKSSQQNGTEQDPENMNLLFMQTLDTLGVLARTIGKKNFLPLAEDCLQLGKNLIENEDDDPDMRRSAYGLFSAIATILEEKLSPYLSFIVKHMLDSLRSSEGVTAHYSDETNGESSSKNFSFLDDDAETDLTTEIDIQNEDDDDDIEGFSVENSFIDEKSDACEALADIAKYTKAEFLPYLQVVFDDVFQLVDFPHLDVRKAGIASSGELTMCSYKLKHETFPIFLAQIFPVICKTIVSDTERLVVMGAIATANQMVECCGMDCFVNGETSLKELMESIHLVMMEKSSCQDQEEADTDDEQAEYDEMLIEYCGEILPVLAASLGCSVFLPYFNVVLPSLLARTKSTCTSTERSFAAGTIAETCQKLGPGSTREIAGHLIPKMEKLTIDSEVDVRNNSIFGIGIILQNSDAVGTKFYPSVLNTLFMVLKEEKNRRVIDNILGAVARMITTDKHSVPLKQALPVLLEHLPIVEDHEEDGIVYSCISMILLEEDFSEALMIHMLTILIRVLGIVEIEQDIKLLITNHMKLLHERKPSLVINVCNKIDSPECQELKNSLQII